MLIPGAKKILLIQLGDIGDVIWTTPTLWAVKKAYPRAEVSILIREGYGALLSGDPSLNQVFEVPRSGGGLLHRGKEQIRFLRSLRREAFSLAIDLRAGDRGAFLACVTGAPVRVALLYRKGVPFWRNRVFTHLINPPLLNEKIRVAAEQSLRIIRGMGIEPCETAPRLWVSEEVDRRVKELLQKEKIPGSGEWITLNPFSRWGYKEWSLEKWSRVIDWLHEEYRISAVITGSPEEQERAKDWVKKCCPGVLNLVGKTSLQELAGLLRLSSLHVGVDSAAPHIAAAVGTRTITIYGPSDWYDWAPVGEGHRVVSPDKECVPCHQKGCRDEGRSECLDELPVEKVLTAIREILS